MSKPTTCPMCGGFVTVTQREVVMRSSHGHRVPTGVMEPVVRTAAPAPAPDERVAALREAVKRLDDAEAAPIHHRSSLTAIALDMMAGAVRRYLAAPAPDERVAALEAALRESALAFHLYGGECTTDFPSCRTVACVAARAALAAKGSGR